MEYVDKLTLLISLINIVTTILLTLVNLIFLKYSNTKSQRRESVINYYLPIKIELEIIKYKFEQYKENLSDKLLFSISSNSSRDAEIRKEIIKLYYERFLNHYDNLVKHIGDSALDKKIFAVCAHMRFLSETFNRESSICAYDTMNIKYPTPCWEEIIKDIDEFIKRAY